MATKGIGGTGAGRAMSAAVGLQTVTSRTLTSSGRAATDSLDGHPLGWPASTTSSSRDAPVVFGVSAGEDALTQSLCGTRAGGAGATVPEKSATSSALREPLATSLPVTALLASSAWPTAPVAMSAF